MQIFSAHSSGKLKKQKRFLQHRNLNSIVRNWPALLYGILLVATGCGTESPSQDANQTANQTLNRELNPPYDTSLEGETIVDDGGTLAAGLGTCSPPAAFAEGSRYISVTPSSESVIPVALLVTAPGYPGVQHYVQANGKLGCSAVFQTPDAWGTVHVNGPLIVPVTMYSVQADCGGGLMSTPMAVSTWKYGDANNSGQINLDDILCVLQGFASNFSVCSRYGDDQLGYDPNGLINLDDILAILVAFAGTTYPGPQPPSTPIIASPELNAHSTMVNSTLIMITGTAPNAVGVEFSNHFGVFQATLGANASFSASVMLAANRVNPVYFTAIDECGRRSAPTLTTITNDGESPNLFIDFPSDSAEVTIPATDVAGRVGDVLSGFMGLSVNVTCPACPPQGINAIVDVGIGNNGTFNAPSVPLNLGANVITATAADALGNQTTRQITITRAAIPPNTPQMMVVSGNGQTAPVHQFLSNPITVKVLKANGDPFVNKVVTFNVNRSDGRLVGEMAADCSGGGTMMLQCHTDANGEVRAMWKMGSDAGCGNNRVEVTSTSIVGTVAFCASASPGPASQINLGSGNNQRVEVNAQAPEPLRARVSDSCNGIENLGVTFTVIQGGGKVRAVGSTQWQDFITVPTAVSGHATVEYLAGPTKGNQLVEANFAGNATNPATFVMYGLERDDAQSTSFSGLLLDNALQPIGGAECKLVVAGRPPLVTTTTSQGQFSFPNVDGSGASDFFVDGAVATTLNGQPIPTGSFPFLHYTPVLVPNTANALPGPVLLPPLDPCNQVTYDGSQDVTLTVRMRDPANPTCDPQQSGCCISAIEGLEMLVKAGTTIRRPDGKCVGPDMSCSGPDDLGQMTLALNQVHHDDVPMPMPDGAAPPFAWTLQPGGATFDIPVLITYPNMSGLPAGSIAYFLSFDHDANKFQIIATGHVTNDAATIVTDANAGLTKAGWGCNCPPYSVTGDCKKPKAFYFVLTDPPSWPRYNSNAYINEVATPNVTDAVSQRQNETSTGINPATVNAMNLEFKIRGPDESAFTLHSVGGYSVLPFLNSQNKFAVKVFPLRSGKTIERAEGTYVLRVWNRDLADDPFNYPQTSGVRDFAMNRLDLIPNTQKPEEFVEIQVSFGSGLNLAGLPTVFEIQEGVYSGS